MFSPSPMSLSFANPHAFWLLFLVPGIIVLKVLGDARARRLLACHRNAAGRDDLADSRNMVDRHFGDHHRGARHAQGNRDHAIGRLAAYPGRIGYRSRDVLDI